jgi:hypothetical protein
MLRVSEFGGAFFHQLVFHFLLIDFGINVGQDVLRGHFVDVAGVGFVEFFHGVVGGGRVGLDVAAGEGFDVFIRGVGRFLGAGAGEDDLLLERKIFVGPEFLVELPEAFDVDDADLALSRGGEGGDVFFGVNVDPGDENAVNAFEARCAVFAALRAAPDIVAGDFVLALREDERDVKRDARGGELFEGVQPGGGGGDLYHPIGMASGPFLAELDVTLDALGVSRGIYFVFKKRIELEADVAVIPLGRCPNRREDILGVINELVGHGPGDGGVVLAFVHEFFNKRIKAPCLDEVRDDDRIGGGAGRAHGEVLFNQFGIDGVEPEFGAGSDEGFEGHGDLLVWRVGNAIRAGSEGLAAFVGKCSAILCGKLQIFYFQLDIGSAHVLVDLRFDGEIDFGAGVELIQHFAVVEGNTFHGG